MKNIISIAAYIVKNNPWYAVPQKMLQALFYQISKRTSQAVYCKQLFNGKKLFLFPHNPIASSFIYTDYPDKEEISLLRELADSNTIFLDIGANMGSYSMQMLDKVQAVFAFEAHPKTANLCKMNFLLNDQDVEQVIFAAVCAEKGEKYFTNLQKGNPTNMLALMKEGNIVVPAITLDDFIRHQPFSSNNNFILKIDVEGFEHEVFAGAKHFLAHYPVKAILFETFSPEIAKIKELLQDFGFQLKKIGQQNLLAFKS